jgi:hypothetical protein
MLKRFIEKNLDEMPSQARGEPKDFDKKPVMTKNDWQK